MFSIPSPVEVRPNVDLEKLRGIFGHEEYKGNDVFFYPESTSRILKFNENERNVFLYNAGLLYEVDRISTRNRGTVAYLRSCGAAGFHDALMRRLDVFMQAFSDGKSAVTLQRQITLSASPSPFVEARIDPIVDLRSYPIRG